MASPRSARGEPSGLTPIADVIVVAAGSSTRMRGLDKLRAPIGGRTLLEWPLGALAGAAVVERIVLVAAADRVAEWRAAPWLPAKVRAVVSGGERRQASVAAGLEALVRLGAEPDRVVLVHDGA